MYLLKEEKDISQLRNKEINMPFTVESDTALQDFIIIIPLQINNTNYLNPIL